MQQGKLYVRLPILKAIIYKIQLFHIGIKDNKWDFSSRHCVKQSTHSSLLTLWRPLPRLLWGRSACSFCLFVQPFRFPATSSSLRTLLWNIELSLTIMGENEQVSFCVILRRAFICHVFSPQQNRKLRKVVRREFYVGCWGSVIRSLPFISTPRLGVHRVPPASPLFPPMRQILLCLPNERGRGVCIKYP